MLHRDWLRAGLVGISTSSGAVGFLSRQSSSGSAAAYQEGNRVVFSNTAAAFAVTLNQQVNPSSVTFGNLSNSYTLTGSGGSGKWNGASAGIACSGRWQASRH